MASLSKGNEANRSAGEPGWRVTDESFEDSLRTLGDALDIPDVGIALYDGSLSCRALNMALVTMTGVEALGHLGKNPRDVFGKKARELEATLNRVFITGRSSLNFDFAAQMPGNTRRKRWLMNFYPLRDKSKQVRLVATLFFKPSRASPKQRLSQLAEMLGTDELRDRSLQREGLTELSARSFELVTLSLELIEKFMNLRSCVLETRVEIGLRRLASCLGLTLGPRFRLRFARMPAKMETNQTRQYTFPDKRGSRDSSPSPRERQVVKQLAGGKSNKEIAAILDLSTRTVEFYRARVMAKLNLHSVADLVRYAVRNNLIEA